MQGAHRCSLWQRRQPDTDGWFPRPSSISHTRHRPQDPVDHPSDRRRDCTRSGQWLPHQPYCRLPKAAFAMPINHRCGSSVTPRRSKLPPQPLSSPLCGSNALSLILLRLLIRRLGIQATGFCPDHVVIEAYEAYEPLPCRVKARGDRHSICGSRSTFPAWSQRWRVSVRRRLLDQETLEAHVLISLVSA